MRVIFHGDDLGLTHSFNRGIFAGCREGLLRSTCLRTNGTAFEAAIRQLAEFPELGVGVHLNLVEGRTGRPVARTEILCGPGGAYRLGFLGLMRALRQPGSPVLAEIEADYRHQIEAVLAAGIKPDHLNSHQHSHLLPRLFDLACRLAREYGIPWVRLVREPFHLGRPAGPYAAGLPWLAPNLAKHLILNRFAEENRRLAAAHGVKVNDCFLGVLHTGHQTLGAIEAGLRRAAAQLPPEATIEVLLHPAMHDPDRPDFYVAGYLRAYTRSPARQAEVDALRSPGLRQLVDELHLAIGNYSIP